MGPGGVLAPRPWGNTRAIGGACYRFAADLTFGIGWFDKLKVSNCAEQDRLSRQWQEAVNAFRDAVALVPKRVEAGNFQERYEAGRLAGESASKACKALELHRATHQRETSGRSVPVAYRKTPVLRGEFSWPGIKNLADSMTEEMIGELPYRYGTHNRRRTALRGGRPSARFRKAVSGESPGRAAR
jgi:hypothetical protein